VDKDQGRHKEMVRGKLKGYSMRRTGGILITGFETFGEVKLNPSEMLAREFAQMPELRGLPLNTAVLPTVFEKACNRITALLDKYTPALLLSLGVAPGPSIRLERLALNWRETRQADNSGVTDGGSDLICGAPAAYWSALKGRSEILEALHAAGIPAAFSNSAGSYVCNAVMYSALHHTASCNMPTSCAFVHIPRLPQDVAALDPDRQAQQSSMPLELSRRAIEIILSLL